jgi:hypothetical protein
MESAMRRYAAIALLALAPLLEIGIAGATGSLGGPAAGPPAAAPAERVVYVGSGLTEEGVIVLGAAVAAARPSSQLLLDTPRAARANQQFLAAYLPPTVIAVGPSPAGAEAVERRLGTRLAETLEWSRGPPEALWKALFPQAERVVVCPAGSRRLLLQSAALAVALRAPLVPLRGEKGEVEDLRKRLVDWRAKEVYATGGAADLLRREGEDVDGLRLAALADEPAVGRECVRVLARRGSVRHLVVANPADTGPDLGGMSLLAPWVAGQRRAALLLTGAGGTNAAEAVRAALKNPHLARADTLTLLANLRALPVEKRPNPVEGKDAEIEMEPLTPRGDEVFSFSTGRLFHAEPALLAAVLARQALLPPPGTPRRALVVSNPGGGLPLLETFSRHTANELRNAGYRTTARFEHDADKDELRRLMPEQDVFLWEGHYRTLIDDFGFLNWSEPLPPMLCFLQSCLALKEEEAQPVMERGAVAVIGSSTRTYSGTGGAFTVAFFDAMLYDGQTLGGALRQAKNFLLAYSLLKEKRLGAKAKLTGVNVRSSWAFSLWGDPALRLPAPPRPDDALDAVGSEVRGNTITLELPDTAYRKVTVGKYEATMRPNGRLAGLLRTGGEAEDARVLVPFVFAEVSLPRAQPGLVPRLRSRLPERNWVFCWDARRRTGYLLVTPRSRDQEEVKFRVEWEEEAPPGS